MVGGTFSGKSTDNTIRNYAEMLIDDINSRFPELETHNYSLRKYIYSIKSHESIISYNVNRKLCKTNILIRNNGKSTDPKEFRAQLDKNSLLFKIKKFFNTKSNFTYFVFLINSIKSIKFFR